MAANVEEKVKKIAALMSARNSSLALAESCTGGLLSSYITKLSGVSNFYQGAVVSYAGQVKQNILGVPHSLLRVHGEVSEPVAKAMAIGAREALNSQWALSITGIAGPNGGTKDKPVGTVCFGLAGPAFVSTKTKYFTGDREQIQLQSCDYALEALIKTLNNE
ncbi:MAG: CinA family protein [Bdellovibrionales bacterium]|nr:CinA family protein [Bdellovibrionales bacterium]